MAENNNFTNKQITRVSFGISFATVSTNKSTACCAKRSAALLLENSKSKMGHNYAKKFEGYLPYWYGFPFDSKQEFRGMLCGTCFVPSH